MLADASPVSPGTTAKTDASLNVAWVSPSYGYGGDLLYFRGLFERFCVAFPATRIFYAPLVRFDDADHLPLDPGLTGWRIDRHRKVGKAMYDASIFLPSPRFAARLRAVRPDVVITIEFTAAALLAIALSAIGRGFAVVLLIEGDPAARGGSANPLIRAIKRLACRMADVIQTSNAAGYRFLTETLHADPGKIRIAPYLTSSPPRPEEIPTRPDGRLRLLFVNSLTSRKGARALLEAIDLLPPETATQVRLTIVGDGPERDRLQEQAARLGKVEIVFAGARRYTELGKFYADADVLAVPSEADYRSLAGFEGLAYGLALLASRNDGASVETLDGGSTGAAIDPADPQGIADAIARFVADRAYLTRCQANAQRLFEHRFSYQNIVENLAESVRIANQAHRSTLDG